MFRPSVTYLRVYEPLTAFGDPPDPVLRAAVDAAKLTRAAAGEREHYLWLKSQLAAPARLLPAELPDGSPAPSGKTDVLTLEPGEVPAETGEVGPGPLVCPLDLRARSAAALVGFLSEAHPVLRDTVLSATGSTLESVKARATSALKGTASPVVHALSTTWTVPLPWFVLIDPAQRRLVLGSGQTDPARELSWRAAIGDAVRRATEARELVERTFGESGPSRILAETVNWLEQFHPGSAVELDYGGLVQLVDDETLESDSSADQVHRILDALRDGNPELLGTYFESLRDYWGDLAAHERAN